MAKNEKQREKSCMSKNNKVIGKIAIVIGMILLVFVLFFVGSYVSGKSKLSKNILQQQEYKTITYQGTEYQYKDNMINVLCLGIDKEEKMAVRNDVDNSIGQADAIFLVSLDLETNDLQIISVPRDTMVTLQMYDSRLNYMGTRPGQITLQYAYADGMEKSSRLMVEQVSALLGGIPINAYVSINVHSLWTLNAAVGGVDITMDEDYTEFNPAFEKGATVHLTEKLLENFIRGRDCNESGSSHERVTRQKKYMLAFFEQAKKELKQDVTLPIRLLDVLEEDMDTDVSLDEVFYLILNGLQCSFSEENMRSLPGEIVKGEKYEEYHLKEDAVQELIIKLFYEEK